MNNQIAILVPTYKRSQRLPAVAKNIHDNTKTPHTIYFIVEPEDKASQEVIQGLGERLIINSAPNTYVSAINTAYRQSTEPIIFCGADDLGFTKGWDEETLKDFADPKIQMVGYPDDWPISKTGLHGSHFSVRRKYIEEVGGVEGEKNTIYFSEYHHMHCDIESENTAQKRGVWKQSKAIINHIHWTSNKSPMDETYKRGLACNDHDWSIYRKRRYNFEQQIFKDLYEGRIVKPFRGSLSIVIPSYNQKAYLQQTIESLKQNTFNPYELIIIDDCSDKETVDYIKSLKSEPNNPPGIRVYNDKQKYVTANWNKGVSMATGDYIAVLNNDITVSEYWDSYLMAALSDDVLVTNPYQTDPGEKTPYGKSARTGSIDIRGTCFMFRKGLFESFGYLPEQLKLWYSDWWLGWHIVNKLQKKTVYVSQSVVFHYGSKSSNDFNKRTGKLREVIARDRIEFEKLTGISGDIAMRIKQAEKDDLRRVVPKVSGSCGGFYFTLGEETMLPASVIRAVGFSNFHYSIANNNGMETDKNTTGLFADYEKLFSELKTIPIKYLEIGIAKGGSLEWAKNYFAKGSSILGVDIQLPAEIPGTSFYRINQNNSEELKKLGKAHGEFDIIIDDGSHMRRETENTFNCLFPFLKTNGCYLIEDWGAGYFPHLPQCKGMETLVVDLVWKHGGTIIRNKSGGTFAIIRK